MEVEHQRCEVDNQQQDGRVRYEQTDAAVAGDENQNKHQCQKAPRHWHEVKNIGGYGTRMDACGFRHYGERYGQQQQRPVACDIAPAVGGVPQSGCEVGHEHEAHPQLRPAVDAVVQKVGARAERVEAYHDNQRHAHCESEHVDGAADNVSGFR